jgi:hypothetical protein
MIKSWKPFMGGVAVTLLILLGGYFYITKNHSEQQQINVPPGTVIIKVLPPLLTLGGFEVPFEGKKEIPQTLASPLAKEVVVVNFQATGENAQKSVIKIVWEDGSIETVPPGTVNKRLSPEKRAKQISIVGYAMHERQIFRDSARKGTISWDIRYVPVEN